MEAISYKKEHSIPSKFLKQIECGKRSSVELLMLNNIRIWRKGIEIFSHETFCHSAEDEEESSDMIAIQSTHLIQHITSLRKGRMCWNGRVRAQASNPLKTKSYGMTLSRSFIGDPITVWWSLNDFARKSGIKLQNPGVKSWIRLIHHDSLL